MLVEVRGGSPCRTCALIATDSRLKTTFGGSRQDTEKQGVQLAVRVLSRPVRSEFPRTESRSYKTARTTAMHKVLERTRHCKASVTIRSMALKFLGNGDSPVKMVVQGPQ